MANGLLVVKVLYTFDDAGKTNCLARWPNLLDIQTAHLDEETQIGVIELKTCIQAIVSASPELVAKLGQDYTVYAYDYSEYETPLVGQGMLSWVLASSSPTPNAPAHQSKTMVTGRVCKNVLGLFSRGVQETLEVKLRLVPVPTVMQSEYIESMQRYRELSNMIPHEFDAQMWTNFLRDNPSILASKSQPDQAASPIDQSGIEKFRQLLSEGSTPREFPAMQNETSRPASPARSIAPSRNSTPGGRPSKHQPQPRQLQRHASHNDAVRPSSSASMQDADFTSMAAFDMRRGSIQSDYASCEEFQEPQPRKRAKLYPAGFPGKSGMNIEKQPSSLRVAASTAASVRIHRPTPINPSIVAEQNSSIEPVRPPTPITNSGDIPRRARPRPSMLREQSNQTAQYTSPYPMSDDHQMGEPNTASPEESRYQGIFEPSFSMPSSPPVVDYGFPGPSSPALPPIATDPDSGFMSGGVEDIIDDDFCIPLDECGQSVSEEARDKRTVRPAISANTPASVAPSEQQTENAPMNAALEERQPTKEAAPPLPRPPPSAAGSRPSSRASVRLAPKPLAPAPMSQSDIEQIMSAVPASDPVVPQGPPQHAQSAGPMSDLPTMETPARKRSSDSGKVRSGTGARRVKQVQARLDQCIRDGQVPPYCQNCGAIETPTWRRAWTKQIEGGEQLAKELSDDPTSLYWQSLEKDDQDQVTKFKLVKKTLLDTDNEFAQVLLCNRKLPCICPSVTALTPEACGLWLHKFKTMRPENKWHNKAASNKRKKTGKVKGPLNGGTQATKTRGKSQSGKPAASSPAETDASSPPVDGITPHADNNHDHENDEESHEPSSKRRRANSTEPRRSSDTARSRWQVQDPMEALRLAIQSSPVGNLDRRNAPTGDKNLTPKPVRRALFPNNQNGGLLKPLAETSANSPRRSPRTATREATKQSQDKENRARSAHNLDSLFESPSFDFDLPTSPTPRRRNTRASALIEKRASLPTQSPASNARKDSSDMTPTKVTAQKLQRIQGSLTPGKNKTPKKARSTGSEMPPLPEDNFDSEAFEGMDTMMANMFGDESTDLFPFDPTKLPGGDWAGWFTSDAASAIGSDEGQQNGGQGSEDFLNAIFSHPDMQKENLQFDPLTFDSSVLDPALFESGPLNQDLAIMGSKGKPPGDSAGKGTKQASNNAS